MQKVFLRIILLSTLFLCTGNAVLAQEVHQDLQGVFKAKVLQVSGEREELIPGTDTPQTIQTVSAEIIGGDRKGEIVEFENDYITLKENQKFFMNYIVTINGSELYSVREVDRSVSLLFLLALFIAVVLVFGRMQGLRSLLSLAGSFIVILYILLPLLLKGYSPILVSVVIGSLILFVAIFFTHGFNVKSLVAFVGTTIAVLLTGLLAFISIKILSLSGFASDEALYLNFSTDGILNFEGLLLGGIIIGVLGVLDDIAVTQVAVVSEMKNAAKHLTNKELFSKAINVGKEHVSALVNTIVLAYAGVSLPLLLWFSQSTAPISVIINNEIFSTEIARTIVGSIGLIMTVPITTFLAVMFLKKGSSDDDSGFKGHVHHH